MSLAARKQMAISQDASELAFRLGQEIQKRLTKKGRDAAARRNAEVVSASDIEAAAAELGVTAIFGRSEPSDGEPARTGPSAA